ncbi:MAG: B12-binding domain-containing radical SAM protein [Candidatus Aminicenantes bacterium]|nr:B12-binding domain-containing radical SAM protein [Candidatus Aminicenantes bacterium]
MKKIIFIEPAPPSFHVFSRFKSPRLGIFILGSMMKKRGWDVEIFVEDMGKLDWERIAAADIVGITSITSTAPRAYKIADIIREMGITVIMGGPHPTFLTEEALQHADFVIRGEGEYPLMAFVDALEKDSDFSEVPNLSYKENGNIVHNRFRKIGTNLDEMPFPDFSMFHAPEKIVRQGSLIPIQTSRGCPFHCSFCSVTAMFGKKYRFRSVENIMQELRQYKDEKHFVFFYDDNFTANPTHTKELLKAIIGENFKFKWSAQVRADATKDEELIELMKKSGCRMVFIGFESANPDSLQEMKKSQKVADIVHAVKVFRKYGIHIHGMFMLGLDSDTWKSIKNTVRFALRSRITSAQFLVITPLPGTELFEQVKSADRILFKDWSLYDAHHVVFKPNKLSIFKLQSAHMYGHKKFYSKIERIRKLIFGNITGVAFNFYANHITHLWKKKNKTFMKILKLLKPNKNADISIDYQTKIKLNFPTD